VTRTKRGRESAHLESKKLHSEKVREEEQEKKPRERYVYLCSPALKKILRLLLGNSGFLWEQEELQHSIKISAVKMYNGFLTIPIIIRLIYYGN